MDMQASDVLQDASASICVVDINALQLLVLGVVVVKGFFSLSPLRSCGGVHPECRLLAQECLRG
jgi:hypothetical protein